MPNDLLELNLGQVRAVVAGYSDRIVDDTIQAINTGYYAAYYLTAKHSKSPNELAQKLLDAVATDTATSKQDVDMDTEIELFNQRALRFLEKGGQVTNG